MDFSDRADRVLQRAMTTIEWVVAALLIVLGVIATIGLVIQFGAIGSGIGQGFNAYIAILDGTLLVFVIAELFKIALAYIRHEDVIPTVMEAALVAVARKVVILDVHEAASVVLMRSGALAIILLAIALSWYLLSRCNPSFARRIANHDK